MTALQQEAISIIQAMPEAELIDFMPVLRERREKQESESEIRDRKKMEALRKLLAKEPPLTEEQRREGKRKAEQFAKCVQEIRELIGDDIPWSSEEEMIEELAKDRRERMERMAQ